MGLGWMQLITLGCMSFALDGICLCCLIEFMVLGWVDLLDSIWFGLITLDWVGYALSGFWFDSLILFNCICWDCTWLDLVFNLLYWLIDCFDVVVFRLCIMLEFVCLTNNYIWQGVEWIDWFGWLMWFGWLEGFDAWHWVGLDLYSTRLEMLGVLWLIGPSGLGFIGFIRLAWVEIVLDR